MKLSLSTVLKHMIDKIVEEWIKKVPEFKLEEYDDWKKNLADRIANQITKRTQIDSLEEEEIIDENIGNNSSKTNIP